MKIPILSFLNRSKKPVLGTLALFVFLVSYWYWLDFREFLKTPIQLEQTSGVFELEKGTGVNRLAAQLSAKGSIKKPIYLKLLAYLHPEIANLKAGEYRIESSIGPIELLTLLSQGQVIQYSFTIIEGQTSWQVLSNLVDAVKLKPLTAQQNQGLVEQLNITSSSIEGWLLPETYYYSSGDSAISILQRAAQSMAEVLQTEWHTRAEGLPYDTPYQALIMASIIEKETGIASERAQIAGVFVRRLRKNMRLGTDPTVIYGIGPEFNGDITYKDLRTATPYNTYMIKGLPPTPIAMPGRKSIWAALHPADGTSLYFVADGTGGHYFSETLTEHNKAVQRMLKRQRGKN